jgi:hypothetical protein
MVQKSDTKENSLAGLATGHHITDLPQHDRRKELANNYNSNARVPMSTIDFILTALTLIALYAAAETIPKASKPHGPDPYLEVDERG